ncbi:hypothetical protein SLT36_11955 [Aminobacter sp. BA135]|uniref:hypothetical protein n=1 Tax=Aminobacter sp. BA135 TaxID=537596 RepID=UPI003D7BECB8
MAKQKLPSEKPQKVSAIEELLAVRLAFSSMEGQHRKHLHDELAKVYNSAMRLCADPDEWMTFCRNAEWTDFPARPKDTDRSEALRFAVRFAVGFPSEKEDKLAATKRVTKLSSALQVLFDEKVPAAEVAERLEERGIEALSREKALRNRVPQAPTVLTVQFPDERSAKLLSGLRSGDRRTFRIHIGKTDGLLIEAKLIRVKNKNPNIIV